MAGGATSFRFVDGRSLFSGANDGKIVYRLHDDRFGVAGTFEVRRCRSAPYFYTHPRIHPDDLPRLYGSTYSAHLQGIDAARREAGDLFRGRSAILGDQGAMENSDLVAYLHEIEGPRVLDFGCHHGLNMELLRLAGFDPVGCDVDAGAVRALRDAGFEVHDASALGAGLAPGSVRTAVMSYVIEHLYEPRRDLALVRRSLAPGGLLVVTTHNIGSVYRYLWGSRWLHWHVPYHVHHFGAASLRRLLDAEGFRVVRVETREPIYWLLMNWNRVRRPAAAGTVNADLYRFPDYPTVRRIAERLRPIHRWVSKDCLMVFARRR